MLSSRDEALLRALARFRIARTSDLTELVFHGVRKDTAAARLRKLFDAGFVNIQAGDRARENVYSLGPQGSAWLERAGEIPPRRPSGGIEHHLAIVRAWSQLAVAVNELPGFALERVRSDWELRENAGVTAGLVVPDALVLLRVTGTNESIRLALEVDRGTEGLGTLRSKLEAYEGLLASPAGLFGLRDIGIGIVLTAEARQRRPAVETLLSERWRNWWVLWNEDEGPGRALCEVRDAIVGSPHEIP